MASNQKTIYVYESFRSTEPNFLGTLFVENVRGRESYSFEYDADWLKSSANYMYLDPDLQLYAGRQYEAADDFEVWETDCTMKYCLKEPEALYDFITGTLKPAPVSSGESTSQQE